ncbi:MAG: UbiD family decarboxylase, partial [Pseudomonadota bacterium]
PENFEIASSVAGGRRRLAAAFGVSPEKANEEFHRRLGSPQPLVEMPTSDAPVHEVVIQGEDVDLSRLPFHPQHEFDGGTYLTSGIDYAVDPETGKTNVGARRLSLRSRRELAFNLTNPSDLRNIYLKTVARGERLPVSFTVGAHPLDLVAASMRSPGDEVELVAALRGEPLPMVKCLTNDLRIPADAEIALEGYFDEHGYREPEGPYGEYMGYYGHMHLNPVFHVTAVTMRSDVLYQTCLHGSGRILDRTDSGNMNALKADATVMRLLRGVVKEPVDVFTKINSGGCQHLRVAIHQRAPGEARKAIAAIFGAVMHFKHVFVVDEDIDIHDDEQMDWAMSTRFQADRDLVILTDMLGMKMDPSLDGRTLATKAGFDLTVPFTRRRGVETLVPKAHQFGGAADFRTVREAIESGPMVFSEIMDAVGSRDGREIALQLDEIRREGLLLRLEDGEYALAREKDPEITRPPGDPIKQTGLATHRYKLRR